MRKRFICALMIATAVPALTLYGSAITPISTKTNTVYASTVENETTQKMGVITALTESNITISVMEQPVGGTPGTTQDTTQNGTPGEVPPQKPDGGQNNMMPPEMSSETLTLKLSTTTTYAKQKAGTETESITYSDLVVGDHVFVTYNADQLVATQVTIMSMGNPPSGMPGDKKQDPNGMGQNDSSIKLTGKLTVDGSKKSVKSKTYKSTSADQNAVLATNSAALTLNKCKLKKSGDSTSTDRSNFYGLNSILCANLGSTITVKNSKLTSSAEGANAIFSTGEKSVVNVKNVTINTTGNSSRGLDATYGGTIIADSVNITTKGAHCAPLATDRGEGTVTVTNGTLNASGDGSPCIYSTGNISVENVTGTATDSQAAVIEGKNSITMVNSKLTGAGLNGVMLYQSTSGDAAEGTSVLNVKNSTIKTTSSGPMFYITNTDSKINLVNAKLVFHSGILINAAGNNTNNWGKVGSNGGNVALKASNQTLKGEVQCDNISKVSMALNKKTKYTGCIDKANTGDVTIRLAKTASWSLTGDSYVTSITDQSTDLSNIKSNGYNIYYDASNTANAWLHNATITLNGGGKLLPMES